ncbi:MAG: alanine--tRNA ligase, partial [Candidatus Zixiibacteriota bacterium]
SEIHFDRGEKYGTGPDDVVNGETERFVEIWNLVFMQFNAKPDGTTEPLPRPSVDTGAGLERIACIMQNADSNYETDVFSDLIGHISDISGRKYHLDERGVSHRVIADHIRALTFCIADGGGLSNEKQGYVLRRILRRAARHGRKLDTREPFIYKLVPSLVLSMGDVYPEIGEKQEHIQNVILNEEESFGRTLDTGLELFDDVVKKIKRAGSTVVPGDEVFKLYDTYGFPVDLTQVMAEEQDLTLDMAGFEHMMARQKEQSRQNAQFQEEGHLERVQYVIRETLSQLPQERLRTEFVRGRFDIQADVVEIFELSGDGAKLLAVVPDKTPFYVEAGGQMGDLGFIECSYFKMRVDHLFKQDDAIVHFGEVIEKKYDDVENIGELKVQLYLDDNRRWDIMRNHTATHLLHAALRQVLGDHVRQSGSYVGPDKLRFDFSHFKPMTADEITQVEEIVNGKILQDFPVETIEDDIEHAKKSGAMAIFGEKYGSKVRVVSIEDFSKELCGGTHVNNVSQIGPFMITLETAVASGVRRIEAVTGREAVAHMLAQKGVIDRIGQTANRPTEELPDAVSETYGKVLELQKEIKRLKAERFSGQAAVGREVKLGKVSFRFHDFGKVETEEMAGWIDSGKEADYPLVSAAIGSVNGKRTYMASSSATSKVDVGKLSKDVLKELGGRGGGKKSFAQGSVPPDVSSEDVFRVFKERLEQHG